MMQLDLEALVQKTLATIKAIFEDPEAVDLAVFNRYSLTTAYAEDRSTPLASKLSHVIGLRAADSLGVFDEHGAVDEAQVKAMDATIDMVRVNSWFEGIDVSHLSDREKVIIEAVVTDAVTSAVEFYRDRIFNALSLAIENATKVNDQELVDRLEKKLQQTSQALFHTVPNMVKARLADYFGLTGNDIPTAHFRVALGSHWLSVGDSDIHYLWDGQKTYRHPFLAKKSLKALFDDITRDTPKHLISYGDDLRALVPDEYGLLDLPEDVRAYNVSVVPFLIEGRITSYKVSIGGHTLFVTHIPKDLSVDALTNAERTLLSKTPKDALWFLGGNGDKRVVEMVKFLDPSVNDYFPFGVDNDTELTDVGELQTDVIVGFNNIEKSSLWSYAMRNEVARLSVDEPKPISKKTVNGQRIYALQALIERHEQGDEHACSDIKLIEGIDPLLLEAANGAKAVEEVVFYQQLKQTGRVNSVLIEHLLSSYRLQELRTKISVMLFDPKNRLVSVDAMLDLFTASLRVYQRKGSLKDPRVCRELLDMFMAEVKSFWRDLHIVHGDALLYRNARKWPKAANLAARMQDFANAFLMAMTPYSEDGHKPLKEVMDKVKRQLDIYQTVTSQDYKTPMVKSFFSLLSLAKSFELEMKAGRSEKWLRSFHQIMESLGIEENDSLSKSCQIFTRIVHVNSASVASPSSKLASLLTALEEIVQRIKIHISEQLSGDIQLDLSENIENRVQLLRRHKGRLQQLKKVNAIFLSREGESLFQDQVAHSIWAKGAALIDKEGTFVGVWDRLKAQLTTKEAAFVDAHHSDYQRLAHNLERLASGTLKISLEKKKQVAKQRLAEVSLSIKKRILSDESPSIISKKGHDMEEIEMTSKAHRMRVLETDLGLPSPPKLLIIDLDEFVDDTEMTLKYVALLVDIIKHAENSGTAVSLVSSRYNIRALLKELERKDSQLVIDYRLVLQHSDLSESESSLEALNVRAKEAYRLAYKSSLLAGESLFVYAVGNAEMIPIKDSLIIDKENMVEGLLVAAHNVGALNSTIRYFKGHSRYFNIDALPGFRTSGFHNTPLVLHVTLEEFIKRLNQLMLPKSPTKSLVAYKGLFALCATTVANKVRESQGELLLPITEHGEADAMQSSVVDHSQMRRLTAIAKIAEYQRQFILSAILNYHEIERVSVARAKATRSQIQRLVALAVGEIEEAFCLRFATPIDGWQGKSYDVLGKIDNILALIKQYEAHIDSSDLLDMKRHLINLSDKLNISHQLAFQLQVIHDWKGLALPIDKQEDAAGGLYEAIEAQVKLLEDALLLQKSAPYLNASAWTDLKSRFDELLQLQRAFVDTYGRNYLEFRISRLTHVFDENFQNLSIVSDGGKLKLDEERENALLVQYVSHPHPEEAPVYLSRLSKMREGFERFRDDVINPCLRQVCNNLNLRFGLTHEEKCHTLNDVVTCLKRRVTAEYISSLGFKDIELLKQVLTMTLSILIEDNRLNVLSDGPSNLILDLIELERSIDDKLKTIDALLVYYPDVKEELALWAKANLKLADAFLEKLTRLFTEKPGGVPHWDGLSGKMAYFVGEEVLSIDIPRPKVVDFNAEDNIATIRQLTDAVFQAGDMKLLTAMKEDIINKTKSGYWNVSYQWLYGSFTLELDGKVYPVPRRVHAMYQRIDKALAAHSSKKRSHLKHRIFAYAKAYEPGYGSSAHTREYFSMFKRGKTERHTEQNVSATIVLPSM